MRGIKTVTQRRGVFWWSTHTPVGVGLLAFRVAGDTLRADAWGQGAEWMVDRFGSLIGDRDETAADFRSDHPFVRQALQKVGTPALGASGCWYEALATAAIGQRVVSADARTSRLRLAWRFGDSSLGGPLPAFPDPQALLRIADHEFHRAGIERSRARVLRVAAKHSTRLEGLSGADPRDADDWLQRLPGVGPWTAALTTAAAAGDPDAVPVGDLHIPRMVVYALSGEPDGDDERMLELLEPFAGHRQRVVRLVKHLRIGPPRHRPAPFRYDIAGI